MKKEILQPNHVDATLFIGVGGIGSDIVKRVADLCIDDDTSAVRFVTLDTDVNDLERVEKGIKITTIQTSSPRSVRDYLEDDPDTANWFPSNNIIDGKTVSEGAGQLRAISRLALNATIKNGNINKLYKELDDLFLKNGKDKNHAIKVVVVSTTAGGTGSGIAMEMGMLIRHYISTNYPESAAIIRGYLILPGVMNGTVINNESEKASLLRNGYATIKEINAFMMQGSGFFESERRLHRYKGLHVTVPTSGGKAVKLNGLPFDFCFLLDRVDSIQHSMKALDQYKINAARTLYEQNIGPMRFSASSKEDNVIKEFMDPAKLGRCRFGGAGSAVLRYPYADVCEYIASDMAQKNLFGEIDSAMTDEESETAITDSWLKYDLMFDKDKKEYDSMPTSADKEPRLYLKYPDYIERSQGDRFSDMIFTKYLRRVVSSAGTVENIVQLSTAAGKYTESYVNKFIDYGIKQFVIPRLGHYDDYNGASEEEYSAAESTAFADRYAQIQSLENIANDTRADMHMANFVNGAFGSKASVRQADLPNYMIQKFVSVNGEAIHPVAVRYLLYKLWAQLEKIVESYKEDLGYSDTLRNIKFGGDTKSSKKEFEVKNGFGATENSLEEMCSALDGLEPDKEHDRKRVCNEKLNSYFGAVESHFTAYFSKCLAEKALPFVKSLCAAYEEFFRSFKDKAVALERRKENIVAGMKYKQGDCTINLFSEPGYLSRLVERVGSEGEVAGEAIFANIHDMLRENAEIEQKRMFDKFNSDVKHDIFDEVMIGSYRAVVEEKYSDSLDLDILHALKLEFTIKCDVDALKAPPQDRDRIAKRVKDHEALDRYIRSKFARGRNLATPSICRKSFDEARDVNAVAYSQYIKDGDGLRVSEYFDEKDASDTVSKYEIRFFRSIYVVMPTQLFQFCAPRVSDDGRPRVEVIDYSDKNGAGECFSQYQMYMDDIGPDSRMNSVITPHIDSRWNSISVMPEIDLDYQEYLMKHIHKAMFYGFMHGIISLRHPSKYDLDRTVYRYLDGRNGYKKLIVSNKTKCDKFYEVLDALYFDRAAVKSIHTSVEALRLQDEQNGVDFEDSHFNIAANKLRLGMLVGDEELGEKDSKDTVVSVFEIPLRYYISLPARQRDAAEIETMIDAGIEALREEVACFDRQDDVNAHTGKILTEQFNLFLSQHPAGNSDTEDIISAVRRKVADVLTDLDVSGRMLSSLKEAVLL